MPCPEGLPSRLLHWVENQLEDTGFVLEEHHRELLLGGNPDAKSMKEYVASVRGVLYDEEELLREIQVYAGLAVEPY